MCKRGLSTASLRIPWLKTKSATLPRDPRGQGSAQGGACGIFDEDFVSKEKEYGISDCGDDDDNDKRSQDQPST